MAVAAAGGGECGRGMDSGEGSGSSSGSRADVGEDGDAPVKDWSKLEMLRGRHSAEVLLFLVEAAEADLGERGGRAMAWRQTERYRSARVRPK